MDEILAPLKSMAKSHWLQRSQDFTYYVLIICINHIVCELCLKELKLQVIHICC